MEYGVVLNEESYSVPVLHKYVYGVVTYSVHMFVCTASVRIPSMRGREPLTKKQPTFAGAAHSHPQRRSMAAAPLIPLHTYMLHAYATCMSKGHSQLQSDWQFICKFRVARRASRINTMKPAAVSKAEDYYDYSAPVAKTIDYRKGRKNTMATAKQ